MARDYSDFKGDKNPNFKTGLTSKEMKERKSPYNSWVNMKQRCKNPNHPKYHRYGGRGITFCESWETVKGFCDWAYSNGWAEGMSLDRINNDGNYDPSNCRWITMSENARKKSTTKISFEDAKKIRKRAILGECEYDLAKEYNVVHGTIWFIVNNFTHVPDGECTKRLQENKARKY